MAVRAQKFPKEFKKQKLSTIDVRFSVIVLLSLLAHVVLILFLVAHIPKMMQSDSIAKIQQSYVNLLADHEMEPPPAVKLDTVPIDLKNVLTISGPTETAPPASGEVIAEAGVPGTGPAGGTGAPAAGSAESQLPTMNEMAEAGRAGGGARRTTLGDVESEVSNVGFLSVLTSGSGYVPKEYIDGISSYSDAENQRLGKVLASLDAMKVSRGPDGKGWGGKSRMERTNPTGGRVVRGTRRDTKALTVDQLIGTIEPTAQVEFKEIDRTKEGVQKIASSIQTRPKIPTTEEEKQRLKRKPEHVRNVINGHRPAIMDCYKRVLRRDPNLKGKVEVRFAIDPDGRVAWVEIVSTTIENPEFTNCIIARIRRWNDFGYGDPTAPDEVYRQVFTFGY